MLNNIGETLNLLFIDSYFSYYPLADGGWGSWLEWAPCSVSCSLGSRRRMRPCNDPRPVMSGSTCIGEEDEEEDCNENECPGPDLYYYS